LDILLDDGGGQNIIREENVHRQRPVFSTGVSQGAGAVDPPIANPTLEVADDVAGWVAAARQGSPEAMGKLAEACRGYLLLVANGELSPQLRGKIGASDIVQETLLRAQQGIGEFRGQDEEQLLAWLRRILLNLLGNVHRDYQQTQRRQVAREAPWGNPGPGDAVMPLAAVGDTPRTAAVAGEEAILLRRALLRLPDEYRRVVVLRNWERLSFDEIGEKLDRSAEAVRKLWSRALCRLEQELDWPDES
jgi:RNA polymerase sigma-70 factor (ECF subfamily)